MTTKLPTKHYTIQKLRKSANSPYFGLAVTDFTFPFPYRKAGDIHVTLVEPNGEQKLVRDVHYMLDGSVVRLNEQSLGLDENSPLEVGLFVARITEPEDIKFVPGHPVKASDLNDLFELQTMRSEELEALVKSQAWVGELPPANPWVGALWVNNNDYRIHCYTDQNIWVDVR